MVKKYFYKIIVSIFVLGSALVYSHTVFAADIHIVSSPKAGVYDVVLSLNPGESINAVKGTILFNEDVTVVPTIDTDASIIPLWIQKPTVSGNSIDFSGIIPGGFSVMYDQFGAQPKMQGNLFSIVFPYDADTDAYTFSFDSTSVYANDGRGTEIPIQSNKITLPVSSNQSDFSSNTSTTTNNSTNNGSDNTPIFFVGSILVILIGGFYLFRKIYFRRKKHQKTSIF